MHTQKREAISDTRWHPMWDKLSRSVLSAHPEPEWKGASVICPCLRGINIEKTPPVWSTDSIWIKLCPIAHWYLLRPQMRREKSTEHQHLEWLKQNGIYGYVLSVRRSYVVLHDLRHIWKCMLSSH
ncbi:unnamed protein product [Echinostoma caproni]|uniref:TTLL4 n=1 Tax=Echinostoma caproni TaxID=27848 RepID=A0A182ZZG0_9TREM|nr:unnamed protein product [Echinostoma caproni]